MNVEQEQVFSLRRFLRYFLEFLQRKNIVDIKFNDGYLKKLK